MARSKRIRIIIEIDVPDGLSRSVISKIAELAMDATITKNSNPVFLSTEKVQTEPYTIRNER